MSLSSPTIHFRSLPPALVEEQKAKHAEEVRDRTKRTNLKLVAKPGLQSEIAARQLAIREAAEISEPCELQPPSLDKNVTPREFVRNFARSICLSKDYQDVTKLRAANGTLHPTIEKLILEYAFGQPTADAGESADAARRALESLSNEELEARADALARGFEIQKRHEAHECGGVPGNCYICKSRPATFSSLPGELKP